MDCNLPGSSVHGIFWAGILEWVAIPPSGDLPDPGIEPMSPVLQADSLLLSHGGEAQSGAARCFCCFNYLCYLSSLITCLEVFCCNGNSPNNLPTPNNILKLSWCLWSSTEELFFLNLYVASSTYRAIFSYNNNNKIPYTLLWHISELNLGAFWTIFRKYFL